MRTRCNLVRHPAAIKERSTDAVVHGIAFLNGNKRELDKMPEDLRERFLEFMERLTARGGSDVAGEGSIQGTLKLMSDDEIQMLVDEFLELSYEAKNTRHRK